MSGQANTDSSAALRTGSENEDLVFVGTGRVFGIVVGAYFGPGAGVATVVGRLAVDSFRGEVVAVARTSDGFNDLAQTRNATAIDGL